MSTTYTDHLTPRPRPATREPSIRDTDPLLVRLLWAGLRTFGVPTVFLAVTLLGCSWMIQQQHEDSRRQTAQQREDSALAREDLAKMIERTFAISEQQIRQQAGTVDALRQVVDELHGMNERLERIERAHHP